MTDPQNEVLTLTLTPVDLLVIEYDKGETYGNECLSFSVQNKNGGTFTHLGSEELIPIITTYSPELTTRQVVAETIAIMNYVERWLQTCEQPYQETPEYDADLDVQEAKMERSAV